MKYLDALLEKYPLVYIAGVLLAALLVPAIIEAYI